MAQAYVLAGELHGARGGHAGAFAAYESRMRPFVTEKQAAARRFASSFAPRTALGLMARNLLTRLMVFPPLAELFLGASVKDRFDLPSYSFD
jgi:2-polyprenyl-6-methoxyphenol hydroxylase-like FAD-dependent oxidoreductase